MCDIGITPKPNYDHNKVLIRMTFQKDMVWEPMGWKWNENEKVHGNKVHIFNSFFMFGVVWFTGWTVREKQARLLVIKGPL